MKFAEIKSGKAIAQGGSAIAAKDSNYKTSIDELVVCPLCGNPVFLKAKNSLFRQPHWAHFPGTGLHCPAKSKPGLINMEAIARSQDKYWRGQSLAAFKNRFVKILLHTYKIKNDPFATPSKAMRLTHLAYQMYIPGLHPNKHIKQWMPDIIPMARNLTVLNECAEFLWEDFVTSPFDNTALVGWGEGRFVDRNADDVSDYLRSALSDCNLMGEMLINRSIFLEAVKFLSLIESSKILKWWVAMHWIELCTRLEGFGFSMWIEDLNRIDIVKYFLLASIADMVHLPWRLLIEDARSGSFQERPIERLIYSPKNPVFDHLFPLLQPIMRSHIKGFGN